MTPPADPAPALLAIDSGSPTVSVAVGAGGRILAERSITQSRSSPALLRLVDEALGAAALDLGHLDGLLALAGPGSFPGLRVGLATRLGLHEARGLPAVALPTLEVLASLAADDDRETVAVVDALRGEWLAESFVAGRSLAPPRCRTAAEILAAEPARLVGHGLARLAEPSGTPPGWIEAGPLAPAAIRLAWARPPAWDPSTLVEPLYLRRPAVTPSYPKQ